MLARAVRKLDEFNARKREELAALKRRAEETADLCSKKRFQPNSHTPVSLAFERPNSLFNLDIEGEDRNVR